MDCQCPLSSGGNYPVQPDIGSYQDVFLWKSPRGFRILSGVTSIGTIENLIVFLRKTKEIEPPPHWFTEPVNRMVPDFIVYVLDAMDRLSITPTVR